MCLEQATTNTKRKKRTPNKEQHKKKYEFNTS